MAIVRIEIDADTSGHAGWKLTAMHDVNNDNDADRLGIISVIEKLTAFNKELGTLATE